MASWAGLDADADLVSAVSSHGPFDLLRVRGTLTAPQPATGIVNNADRRQLLRHVQTDMMGHRTASDGEDHRAKNARIAALSEDQPAAAITRCPHQQIGNDTFTWFGTRASKSRLNFLDLLRAGHGEYVINAAALAYMRSRSLAGPVLSRLAAERQTRFVDHTAWQAHLRRLGITELQVTPDPVCIATEGALWGAVAAHGFLQNAVIVSDDAGQFAVGQHALCWVHAERLVHKLDTFTDLHRAAQERMRDLIWWFYADLKAYRTEPTARRRSEMRARFDRIFHRRTGFATLDRLLERLHANKPELLMVLDRPEIPLHTNGSERDIRCHVIKRKISGGTRSHAGRDCRDAFLGLMHTCTKLGIAFWDLYGARFVKLKMFVWAAFTEFRNQRPEAELADGARLCPRHELVFGGPKRVRTTMQSCASAAKLRGGGPILSPAFAAISQIG